MSGLSLYQIEDNLAALLDTEALVSDQDRAEFDHELTEAIAASVDKRQRCGEFIRHCELQASACKAEIARLQALAARYEAAGERMEDYIAAVIEAQGEPDPKKPGRLKYPKLEGRTFVFSIARKPGHVEIENEDAIPMSCKSVTAKVNFCGNLATQIIFELDSLMADWNKRGLAFVFDMQCTPSKSKIKEAIESGETVDGARWEMGDFRLVVDGGKI